MSVRIDLKPINRKSASRVAILAFGGAATLALAIGSARPSLAESATPVVSFSKQVLPIFEQHCTSCHSPGNLGEMATSLDLTSYKELRMGSVGGVALVPGFSDRSPMMKLIRDNWKSTSPALKMPPVGPQLSPDEINTIAKWIDQGAKNN